MFDRGIFFLHVIRALPDQTPISKKYARGKWLVCVHKLDTYIINRHTKFVTIFDMAIFTRKRS